MKLFSCLVAVLLFLFQAAPGKGQDPGGVCIYEVRVFVIPFRDVPYFLVLELKGQMKPK